MASTQGYVRLPGPHGYNNYVVSDPGHIGARGYIDPTTGHPYRHSYQPYARNLANGMEAQVRENNHTVRS